MADLRLEWIDPETLTPNPANWRRHPKVQKDALEAVIKEVGWVGALLYNESTERLIDGHLRQEISHNGLVPVLIGSWTEEQERLILATLDPIAALAEAESSALTTLLESIETEDEQIMALLEALAEQEGIDLGDEPVPDPGAQIDKAAELQEKWQVEMGDLFIVGDHRLVCGDCTDGAVVERVMGGEKAEAVVTDPPFAVRDDDWDKFNGEDGFIDFTASWLAVGKSLAGVIVCFMADKNVPLLREAAARARIPYRRALIWRKPPGSQFAGASLDGFWFDFEIIQVFGAPGFKPPKQTRMAVLEHRTITGQEHGCEKPVELLADLVSGYSERGGTVIDMFSATGTTAVACEQLGRRCRGIEIEPKYCAVTLERLFQMGLKPARLE